MFIRFTVRVFREWVINLCVFVSFPFGFEGETWNLIVIIPDHCLSLYLLNNIKSVKAKTI